MARCQNHPGLFLHHCREPAEWEEALWHRVLARVQEPDRSLAGRRAAELGHQPAPLVSNLAASRRIRHAIPSFHRRNPNCRRTIPNIRRRNPNRRHNRLGASPSRRWNPSFLHSNPSFRRRNPSFRPRIPSYPIGRRRWRRSQPTRQRPRPCPATSFSAQVSTSDLFSPQTSGKSTPTAC